MGRPLAAVPWMVAAGTGAAAAIWLTTAWLLGTANTANPGTDRARVRVEAVRTGLAAGAGAGAAVGLLLAFRRQAHQEFDSAERRVTELYNAAAEQLGSDKAPVRLTALYTLERLANDNPAHRQTIVNIICAYLRMPYTPPGPGSGPGASDEAARRAEARRHVLRYRAARAGHAAPTEPAEPDPHEERQVRLTAQRLLSTHLSPYSTVHWGDLSLDLTGATLIDFSLRRCRLQAVDFRDATFVGTAVLGGATYTGRADFTGATFSGNALFDWARFEQLADFTAATFSGTAIFDQVNFSGVARFDDASFSNTRLIGVFHQYARFHGTTFTGETNFRGAVFRREVEVDGATLADRGLRYEFPPSWRIEPTGGTAGRLAIERTPNGA